MATTTFVNGVTLTDAGWFNDVDALVYEGVFPSGITSVVPDASDGASLGTASLMWSDLFLASGAVINFNNGDVTVTHSANTLAFSGATSGYTFSNGVTVTTGTLRAGSSFVAEGTTHAIGVDTTVGWVGLRVNMSLTSSGGSTFALGLDCDPSLTLAAGDTNYAAKLGVAGGTITTQGQSETIDHIAALRVGDPIISVGTGDTVTVAATVYIVDAPTEGTTNAALYVASGSTYLGGALTVNGGQIVFPAAQSASANANTLDDYEEGTFTQTPNSNLTLTAALAVGHYTKIGNKVTCCGRIDVDTVSGTDAITISLPFTSKAAASNSDGAAVGACLPNAVNIGDAGLTCYVAAGSSSLNFFAVNDNAAFAQLTNAELAAGDDIYWTITYMV